MRTEQEIREVIEHTENLIKSGIYANDTIALLEQNIQSLKWVLDEVKNVVE